MDTIFTLTAIHPESDPDEAIKRHTWCWAKSFDEAMDIKDRQLSIDEMFFDNYILNDVAYLVAEEWGSGYYHTSKSEHWFRFSSFKNRVPGEIEHISKPEEFTDIVCFAMG